jgi:hypothetical protein
MRIASMVIVAFNPTADFLENGFDIAKDGVDVARRIIINSTVLYNID